MGDLGLEERRKRPYAYRCEDKSLLSAWIARVLAPPIQRVLPPTVTPNDVTAVGSALCWLAPAVVWLSPAGAAAGPLIGAALLWSYCVLDHVDGLHARMTGRSSPWGEYLDHALDAWNVSLIIGAIALVHPGACRPETVVAAIAVSGLATSGLWLEQYERGTLYLGALGPVEAVLLAGLCLISWAFAGAAQFWVSPIPEIQLSHADIVLLLGTVGSGVCAAAVWRISPGSRIALVLLSSEFAASAFLGLAGAVPWVVAAVVMAMTAAIYAGRVIKAYLTHAQRPFPDWIGGAGLALVALLLHFGLPTLLAWAVPCALAFRAVLAWFSARSQCRLVS